MTLSLPRTPLPPPWSLQSLPGAALSALKTPFLGCERSAPLSRAGPHPEGHLPAAIGCEPPTRLAALPPRAQPLQLLPGQPCRRECVVPRPPGLQSPYQESQTRSVTLEFKPHDWAWDPDGGGGRAESPHSRPPWRLRIYPLERSRGRVWGRGKQVVASGALAPGSPPGPAAPASGRVRPPALFARRLEAHHKVNELRGRPLSHL